MAKRCSKRRGAGMHRRTRRGGQDAATDGRGLMRGGRKKMMRTRRRNRRGGVRGTGPGGGGSVW